MIRKERVGNSSPKSPPESAVEVGAVLEPGESTGSLFDLKSWKVGIIGPLAITLINAFGWLAMYLLVFSPQLDHNKAQSKLFDAQLEKLQRANHKLVEQLELLEMSSRVQLNNTNRRFIEQQVGRLEATASQLENQHAKIRARTQSPIDLNSVRQGLRPNLLFGKFTFTFTPSDEVELEHAIKNIGSNPALVAAPTIRLSLKPITDEASKDALLVPNRDYSIRAYQPGLFQPGYVTRISYSIKLLNPALKGTAIHYQLKWLVSTEQSAVATAAQTLAKHISSTELKRLSVFTQRLHGTVTFVK